MERKNISVNFNFDIKEVTDLNKSFALAKVAIAYTGRNRNMSSISKTTFENALSTLHNVPVVGRYDETENSFGGHDIKIIHDSDEVKIVNATTPFGVVPESANQYWENVIEKDGTIREYLYTDIILWKRQYGYDYLVEKQSIGQSMEISFSNYVIDQDGYCIIDDFEFDALCLIDCEPCFESASVQLFSKKEVSNYKSQFSAMVDDLKDLMQEQSIKLDFSIDNDKEGGKEDLNKEKIIEILAEYSLTLEEVNFETNEDMTEDDLREKVDEFLKQQEVPEDDTAQKDESTDEETPDAKEETGEEYVLKSEFDALNSTLEELKEEFNTYKTEYSTPNADVETLKNFQNTTLATKRETEETEMFAQFNEKLNGDAEYEALKADCKDMSLPDISKECFAILGKKVAKFSATKPKSNSIKIPVVDPSDVGNSTPYGDVYDKYLK